MTTELINALISGGLGLIISLTYMFTGKVSKNFARTLIILPILVCVVMICVNGNLGASVAVMGAFSLIRFRSLQGNSRDIGFIFFAMTAGIACSVGQILFAGIITLVICIVHAILTLTKYGEKKDDEQLLRITIPENLDYTDIFDDLFVKYTKSGKLIKVKTTNMGSMYELTYSIKLRNVGCIKEFMDDIRVRNGNLTVMINRAEQNVAEEL